MPPPNWYEEVAGDYVVAPPGLRYETFTLDGLGPTPVVTFDSFGSMTAEQVLAAREWLQREVASNLLTPAAALRPEPVVAPLAVAARRYDFDFE